MPLPPLETGAVQFTIACALPGVAVTPVGAPGGAAGVTAAEEVEGALLPTAFVATTVKVYGVPLARPATVAVVTAPTLTGVVGGFEVTVYPVMALPPLEAGAVQFTTA